MRTIYYIGKWLHVNYSIRHNNNYAIYRNTNNVLEYYNRSFFRWHISNWTLKDVKCNPKLAGFKSFKRISKKDVFLELL